MNASKKVQMAKFKLFLWCWHSTRKLQSDSHSNVEFCGRPLKANSLACCENSFHKFHKVILSPDIRGPAVTNIGRCLRLHYAQLSTFKLGHVIWCVYYGVEQKIKREIILSREHQHDIYFHKLPVDDDKLERIVGSVYEIWWDFKAWFNFLNQMKIFEIIFKIFFEISCKLNWVDWVKFSQKH